MRRLTIRLIAVCAAVMTVSVTATAPAEAQYFGRNKVQYREFDFEVLKTSHFDILRGAEIHTPV
jgi:hypothetical protein